MAWQALLRAMGFGATTIFFSHSPGFCATKFSVHTLHPEICAKVKRKSIELSAFWTLLTCLPFFCSFRLLCPAFFYLFHILSRVMSVLITVARLHSVFLSFGGWNRPVPQESVCRWGQSQKTNKRPSTAFEFSYSNLNLTSVADFNRVSWSFRVG